MGAVKEFFRPAHSAKAAAAIGKDKREGVLHEPLRDAIALKGTVVLVNGANCLHR